MTTPSPGKGPGMPNALAAHLRAMQATAVQLQTILTALEGLLDDPGQRDLCLSLTLAALPLARTLNTGLDSTALPEGEA